jgi:hypothetical protein
MWARKEGQAFCQAIGLSLEETLLNFRHLGAGFVATSMRDGSIQLNCLHNEKIWHVTGNNLAKCWEAKFPVVITILSDTELQVDLYILLKKLLFI